MHHRAIRSVVCSLVLAFSTHFVIHAQTPAPTDIYEHFIGTWVGTDAYIKDGANRKIDVKIVITKTKKKDRLQLDYVYDQKGTPDFDHETRFLKLNPARAEFDLWWRGNSKQTYKATGLDEFVKSGLGKFTGTRKNLDSTDQDRISRVILTLTGETLSYEWQHGPDENHLVFLSMFTLSRSAATAQP